MRVILASASPRRKALLEVLGIDFAIDPADVEEQCRPGELPAGYVERIALEKARTVATRHPAALVLGADTEVVMGDVVFGKPVDDADAARMLRALSDRVHQVLTGFALVGSGRELTQVVATSVTLRPLADAEITAYVMTGEPGGKAGGYAIQGLAGGFVDRIDGSYTNVVGLPVAEVACAVRAFLAAAQPG